MFDYDVQFRAYHDVKVNLPQAVRDKLIKHRGANQNRLIANMPNGISVTASSFVPQGSYAVRTTIQEAGNAYDIDDGLVIPRDQLQWPGGLDYPSTYVKDMVRDAVKDARFNKEPEILPNCVRVFYGEGHHVDIATFRTYQEGDEIIKEIASDTGWKASDPRRITVWFHDTIVSLNAGTAGAGSQLRRLVRMLKRFAKSRGDDWDMPNGLKLTMLAVECHTPHDRDDEAFRSLLQSMSTRLMTDLAVLDLSDPGEAKVQLTKTSWDSNMMLLRDKTAEALGQLEVLDLRSCTSGDAAVAWDWVFQSDGFIQAFEKDAANAVEVFEKAVLAEAGLASTDSAMRIGTAGVANKEHRFYGDT